MANKNAIPPEQGKFEPGKSGNPNGRPKGVPNTATRLQRFLNATMRGKNPVTKEDEDFTVAELMDLKQIQKALNGDTAAWEKILDRMEGKAMQRNEHSGVGGSAIEINTGSLTTEEKRRLLELSKKARQAE